jgi:hypothetical protein
VTGLVSAAFGLALPALAPTAAAGPAVPREKDHFELFLSAQASTDDNVLQTEAGSGREYLGDLGARVQYRHRWTRSWFRLGAHGGAQRFADRSDLSRLRYGGEAYLAVSPSARTSLTAEQTFLSTYARDLQSLVESGVALPLEEANLAESRVVIERRLRGRWTVGAEGTFRHLEFPDRRLADGDELGMEVSARRRLRLSRVASFTYAYQHGWADGFEEGSHAATAGLARRPARGFGYDLRAGAAYLAGPGRLTAAGGAEMSVTRRRGRVAARYDRRAHHALGLARQVISDVVGLDVSRRLSRRATVTAGGPVGFNSDPRDGEFRYRSDVFSADLDWALTRDLGARGGCSYTRIDSEAYEASPSTRCSVSLGYRMQWR